MRGEPRCGVRIYSDADNRHFSSSSAKLPANSGVAGIRALEVLTQREPNATVAGASTGVARSCSDAATPSAARLVSDLPSPPPLSLPASLATASLRARFVLELDKDAAPLAADDAAEAVPAALSRNFELNVPTPVYVVFKTPSRLVYFQHAADRYYERRSRVGKIGSSVQCRDRKPDFPFFSPFYLVFLKS